MIGSGLGVGKHLSNDRGNIMVEFKNLLSRSCNCH